VVEITAFGLDNCQTPLVYLYKQQRKGKTMWITEDGIVEYEADGDCTLCDNWGCEVCG